MTKPLPLVVALTFCASTFSIFPVLAQNTSVYTQHNNAKRTGWNAHETVLTTANVNQATFKKAYSMPVDDQIFAQPLVVSNLSIANSIHNVLLVATVNNTVYAFDADKAGTFWTHNYTQSGQRPPNNKDMTGACNGNYNDFRSNIGIVGTPVIDSVSMTMYFVARSTTTPAGSHGTGLFSQYLHAIDIRTGNERPNSPVQISASIAGTGDGSVNGVLSFNNQHENQRAGLLLLNQVVYITYAGHCDWPPYHGWILGYNENSLQQTCVFNSTPDGVNGGIWMSGAGPAADDNGSIYVSVGNGTVGTPTAGSRNYAESALKLTPSGNTLAVSSFFTPLNWQNLNYADLDFGVTEIMLPPSTNAAITGCKDGSIYLMNKDNLGSTSTSVNNVLQTLNIGTGKSLKSSFSWFRGSSKEFFYTWSENAALKAFPYLRSTGLFDLSKVVIGNAQGPTGTNGALLAVSSNGNKDGTGILWAYHSSSGDAGQFVVPGILRAFDANDVTKELWNSNQTPGDQVGLYAKFVCPTIANGKVYLATFSNQLIVYGVSDTIIATGPCTGSGDLAKGRRVVASSVESAAYPATNAVDSIISTRWSSQRSDPQWIYVDLGSRYTICKVSLVWEAAYGKDYNLQISDDATNWTTLSAVTGNTSLTNTLNVSGAGRYVRMLGIARGTQYGYSLYEFQVFGSSANSCPVPMNLTATAINQTGASLSWSATPGVQSYSVRYKTVGASMYTTQTTTASNLALSSLSCGLDYLFDVQALCGTSPGAISGDKAFSTLACDGSCGFLPTRWLSQDIGKTRLPGSTCYNNSKFHIKASGAGISGNADGLQMAYKSFVGDGAVTVRVDSILARDPLAIAGIMFRESSDSTSRDAFIGLNNTTSGGAVFQYRVLTGGPAAGSSMSGIQLPYYLKLIKRGTSYAGYISADSLLWKQVGSSVNTGFGTGPVIAGLVLSGHDNLTLANAVFSHVPIIFSSDTSVNTGSGNCPSVNQAYQRPAASSSTLSGDKSSYDFNAFDGNGSTSWTSAPGIDPQWLYFDLGKTFQLCQATVVWGAQYAKSYQIQSSVDAVSWNTLKTITGNNSLVNTVALTGSGRFVRVFANQRGTALGYSIAELQVQGTAIQNQSPNIALNKPAFSSSNENPNELPVNALDGLGYTRWASQRVDPSWIYMDLGSTYTINQVVLDWEAALGKDFQIQISNDAVAWRNLQTVTGNTLYTNVLPVTGTGRYVRMFGTARGTPYGYSLYEFEVDGTPGGGAALLQAARLNSAVKVYPVPVKDVLTVETSDTFTNDPGLVDLGSNAMIRPVFLSRTPNKVSLNVASLRNGVYVVLSYTTKGRVSTLVIIQK